MPWGILPLPSEEALDEVALSISDFINPMDDVRAFQVYPFRVTFWVAGFPEASPFS